MEKTAMHSFLQAIYSNNSQVLCCYDMTGNMVYCSEAYLAFFELSSAEEVQAFFANHSPRTHNDTNDYKSFYLEHLTKAFNQGAHTFPWEHLLPSGKKMCVQYMLTRMEYEGTPFVTAVLLNIENKNSMLENFYLQDSNAKVMIEASPLAICLWDREHNLVDCNSAFMQLFGIETKEEYSQAPENFYPREQHNGMCSQEYSRHLLNEAFVTGQCKNDWLWRDKMGNTIPTYVFMRRTQFGHIDMVAEYIYDVRTLNEVHHRATQAELRNQVVLEAMPLSMSFWDKDYKLIDCNTASIKLFGFKDKDEYLEKYNEVSPEFQPDGSISLESLHKKFQEAMVHGISHVEWMHKRPDGTPIPVDKVCVRAHLNNENVIITFSRDLREIYATKQKAAESEARNKAVLDAMPLSMSLWNKAYELIDCNLASIKLFGFKDKGEYLQKYRETSPQFQPHGEDSFAALHAKFDEAMKNGISHLEFTHKLPDGSPVPVDKTCVKGQLHDEDVLITFSRDLRAIKASERKAEEAEERNKLMFESMPLGVHFWDNKLNLIDCNDASLRLFGFTSKEAFQQNFSSTFPEVQPSGERSLEVFHKCLRKALAEGHAHTEFLSYTQNNHETYGNLLHIEVTLTRIAYKGAYGVICYIRDLRKLKAMLAEIQKVEDNLRHAKEVAEKSTAAKSEFLANMSHELRTPMNGILGLLHLLEKTPLSNDQGTYVQKSLLSANNLLRIINDILDFSNIEAGLFEFKHHPFTMQSVLKDTIELYTPLFESKGLTFRTSIESGPTQLMGDALRLKQVLFNILDNALKFTNEGTVSLHIQEKILQSTQRQYVFSIQDTGIGMTPEYTSRLFSAFSQEDSSFTRAYGGTGLGLVISRNIMHMMRGDIWAESTLGTGSTFYCSAIFEMIDCPIENETEQRPTPATPQIKSQGARILLVEDNDINQMVAEEILSHVGYKVDIANNGQEALNMLEEKNYDLVLMDIQMPIMDGLTATRKIREQAKFALLPIVAMSAHAAPEDIQKSLASGMNEHTTKPINPELLYKTIDYWIQEAAASR